MTYNSEQTVAEVTPNPRCASVCRDIVERNMMTAIVRPLILVASLLLVSSGSIAQSKKDSGENFNQHPREHSQ